jgi:hypothetical protein
MCPPSVDAMIRKNTETPVGSEAGSGARSRTCSGIFMAAAAVVNPFVSAAAQITRTG